MSCVGMVKHSETEEELVLYRPRAMDDQLWVRGRWRCGTR